MSDYNDFLKTKEFCTPECGFDVSKESMNKNLFDWQKDIVHWALRKGRAALFEDCGLGKTIQQLEWANEVSKRCSMPVLILAPLAVADQTKREGERFGYDVTICRTQNDVHDGINITNYEMLEHFKPECFCGIVLDESSILKNFTGKMRTQITDLFHSTPYKLSCTATPAPNDYMELGNQAEFLGVMTRSEMLATFFLHDGSNTSAWRLKGHAEDKFWQWMSTWAAVLTKPSDIGYDSDGYDLPNLNMIERIAKNDEQIDGDQFSFFSKTAMTLSERRAARRNSIDTRCQIAADLVSAKPNEQWLIWCDLNAESEKISSMIPGSAEIKGSDTNEWKTETMMKFSREELSCLVTKPSIAGYGLNWQNCHNMIFVGMSDSYEMMYQAIRRCWRFGQKSPVDVYIVISENEGAVKENVERKEAQSQKMIREMVAHTKEILERDIKGTVRLTIPYNPTFDMILPEWMVS